jgi:hypothetical protein
LRGDADRTKAFALFKKAHYPLSRKEGHVGAVAFSRTGDPATGDPATGDPATGDFSDAKVLKKFGDVPDDLSGL